MRELLRLKVDVIVAFSPPAIAAAKRATSSVPVVFVFSAEPVATGLVPNLNRPGGNLTGLAWDHGFETYAKQLELMKETVPNLRRVAILWDAAPDATHEIYMRFYERAAPRLGLAIVSTSVRQASDLAPAFARMQHEGAQALIVLPSAQVTVPQRAAIMEHATRARLPTLAGIMQYEYPGALFQNAPNHTDYPERAAAYVDRILKGAKPGDLPIEQPNKYDLVVDLRAARTLGLTIPGSVLLRADKVLE
jgi:putative ABC transport system substrate-binding protein